VYLERFNMWVKATYKTYVAFASKLCTLLEYYLQSRDGKDDVSVCTLVDSGAQLPVINAELIQNQNPEVIRKSNCNHFVEMQMMPGFDQEFRQGRTPELPKYILLIVLWCQNLLNNSLLQPEFIT